LLAQSGHHGRGDPCPLSWTKRSGPSSVIPRLDGSINYSQQRRYDSNSQKVGISKIHGPQNRRDSNTTGIH
jgi:hypothetical protein